MEEDNKDKKIDDLEEVKKMLSTIVSEDHDEISCTRLGLASSEKIRPVLVTFPSQKQKEKIMRNAKNLKGTPYQQLSLAHDLTKKQREELKNLLEETRDREKSGEGKYRVVGGPGYLRVVKAKRQ